jgi:hypothetical protein
MSTIDGCYPKFVRFSARSTNCYPSDRMMHQVPEWFVQQLPWNGAVRSRLLYRRHCSGEARLAALGPASAQKQLMTSMSASPKFGGFSQSRPGRPS